MRVLRSFLLLMGVAIAVAGCAQQPTAYFAYPGAGMSGIDGVVYGAGGSYAPMMAGGYAPAMAAGYAPMAAGYAPSMAAGYAPSPYGGLYGYAAPMPGQAGYTLDSGDRLRIVVFGQDGLTNSYAVDASGNIDMPLVGAVGARGLTTDQLAGRIAERLRDGYIREPHVAVEVEAYRPFFILGEVTQPGQYPYVANMTAETAVAIAGGFTPRASRKSVVLTRSYYGRPMRIAVPLSFPLRPGDTISVQERWF
jgi:polysaccharide biosynthesis/export protein